MTDEPVTLKIDADTRAISSKLSELEVTANSFGAALSRAFKSSIVSGNDLNQVMKKLALSLSNMALNRALAPLEKSVGSALGGLFSNVASSAFQTPQNVQAFAQGGIVNSPTYFPMGNGNSSPSMGLMGEAGSEAILPLARGPDGSLGVTTQASVASPMQITFNISTPDLEGFARSEAQMTAMLARAVNRGRRGL